MVDEEFTLYGDIREAKKERGVKFILLRNVFHGKAKKSAKLFIFEIHLQSYISFKKKYKHFLLNLLFILFCRSFLYALCFLPLRLLEFLFLLYATTKEQSE